MFDNWSPPGGTMNARSATPIAWRAPDVNTARKEADGAGLLVLVDFFSPT
jgi:hypothetical protein